jgi:cold shock CspA family protein
VTSENVMSLLGGNGRPLKRPRGKMLWFNEVKNYGVIATDDGRLAVAGSAFEDEPPQGPCSGLVVEFDLEAGDDGPRAERVRLVPEPVAAHRARRRRSH